MTEVQPIAGPSSIPLYLINGVATIWDAQTAATLHCQYDISGLRVGTLPGVGQQNGFLGLPMTLMQEETAYLVGKGIAHLIPISPTPQSTTPEHVSEQRQLRIERITKLENLAKEEAERTALAAREMFAKGGEKAKAKREERARLKAAAKAHAHAQAEGEGGLFGSEEIGQVASPSTSSPMKAVEQSKSEINTIGHGHDNSKLETPPAPTPAPTPKSAQTQTQTQNPAPTPGHFHTTPSHPSHHNSYLAPITSTPHSLFPFPNNNSPREIAKSKTFNTLNSLNYRMGLGPRFGGEYLIYPGDYLRYHAHFTSQVVCWDQSIRPIEIVAWGRLGTGTKKAGLICCVPASGASEGSGVSGATKGFAGSTSTDREESREEEEKGGVEFYSLEWANFG